MIAFGAALICVITILFWAESVAGSAKRLVLSRTRLARHIQKAAVAISPIQGEATLAKAGSI